MNAGRGLRVSASYDYHRERATGDKIAQAFEFSGTVGPGAVYNREGQRAAQQAAEDWIREHNPPRSLRIKATTLSTSSEVHPYVASTADLRPKSGNVANETGVKRYRDLLKWLDREGIAYTWEAPYGNAYATRAEFEKAIGL